MDQNDPTTSRLTINNASTKHSGNYNCTATNIIPSSVNIFVSKGDKTAAIQRLGSGGGPSVIAASGVVTSVALPILIMLVMVLMLDEVWMGNNSSSNHNHQISYDDDDAT
ncbi:hypothetical protein Pcinc_034736 [Petrolisthes cinctipes]|uniref:Ig-like domain-containing protein n=1 Tax=Petrolisthes cinctipes TaxID=88211 RepID=A0AAE1BY15_PETCI|nr:hypothetical protein Pcinc_034736 [Petrolisthes cinctipes]